MHAEVLAAAELDILTIATGDHRHAQMCVDGAGAGVRAIMVEEKHTNLGGVVHGGVLMSFVDVIMGTTSYRHAGRSGASIRIVSDFVAPARIGDWLEGRGEVVKATRSVVFARGLLTVEGRTILTATGNYKLRGEPRFDR